MWRAALVIVVFLLPVRTIADPLSITGTNLLN